MVEEMRDAGTTHTCTHHAHTCSRQPGEHTLCRQYTCCHHVTVPPCSQDYFFVQEFVRFTAITLSKAPAEHFDVLLGGLAALKDELRWFQV